MLIQTRRFGTIEVDEGKLITFKEGLLGLAEHRTFALIQTSPDPVFFWMQAVDDPDLALLVCDPLTFVPDYQVPIRKEDVEALELRDLEAAVVLVIVNKVNGDLTGNLAGPIVVCPQSLLAKQLVLEGDRYNTRHRLLSADVLATTNRTGGGLAKTA